MLRSHAALCLSTGSLEMFVFHTLFAGNIGQFGAPGTVVPAAAGVPPWCAVRVVLAEAVADGAADADPAAGNVAHAELRRVTGRGQRRAGGR